MENRAGRPEVDVGLSVDVEVSVVMGRGLRGKGGAWGGAAVDAAHARGAVGFSAGGQPFVTLYDLESGAIEAMLRYAAPELTSAAVSLAFSPDGALLAELRPEGRCIVWNVEEREHTRLIDLEAPRPGFPVGAHAVAFAPGVGPYLIATTTASLEVWDLDVPERVRQSGAAVGQSLGGPFSLSPDGRVLAGPADGGLGLYYLRTLEPIRTLSSTPVPGVGYQGVFSPNGLRLAVGNLVFTGWGE